MSAIVWWAVELSADGKCLRCERVFSAAVVREEGRCYLVEAASESGALAAALEQYRQRQRKLLNARRAERKAAGLCPRCGRPRDSETTWCSACLSLNQTKHHRPPPTPPDVQGRSERGADIARTRRSTQAMARLRALLDCKTQWQAAEGPDQARRWLKWLDSEIAALNAGARGQNSQK